MSEDVRVGDHIAYFWESDAEFERGVRFLIEGVRSGDHCVIFGHDPANLRVLTILEQHGVRVADLQRDARLTVAGRASTGEEILGSLGAIFQQAVDRGAPLIRLLGNIGWGHEGWPDEDDLLLFEARVTGAAKSFPSVVVCMYDVSTLPGRVVVNGGLGTHPITVCGNVMRVNPHYLDPLEFQHRVEQLAAERRRKT